MAGEERRTESRNQQIGKTPARPLEKDSEDFSGNPFNLGVSHLGELIKYKNLIN